MTPLIVVLLIVLVDLMGFTIVMPLLPRFATQYGFSPGQIGLLLAMYPLCQLIAGPILGKLSDRYGRRPVLAVSQFGTALGFLILGLSHNYWVMLFARALDGVSGGNFLVAQAYIADVTKPADRAKAYGYFGAAFGVGFVLGPLLALGVLGLPVGAEWRLRLPFLVAAGFSTLAWVLVLFKLPESSTADTREAARIVTWRSVVATLGRPAVGPLVIIGAMTTLAFSSLEGTYALYLKSRFNATEGQGLLGFTLFGAVALVVQGGLIRRLIPRYGEGRLIVAGLTLMAVGLAGLAVATSWGVMILASIILGSGYGVTGPSGMGLLSRLTPPSEQGSVFGVLASAQTLARMVNYLVALNLFGLSGPTAAYWEGSAIAVVGLMIAARVVSRPPIARLAPRRPEAEPVASG